MELFKFRSLALGCGCFLALLFCSYYFNTAIRIAILIVSGIAIVTVILVYLISKRGLKILIRLIPTLIFVILSMVVSLITFDKRELLLYCDQDTYYEVECTVTSVDYQTKYMGIYTVKTHRVGENSVKEGAKLYAYGNELSRGDVVQALGLLYKIESDPMDFDEKGYNLSKGVEVIIESEEFSVVSHKSTPILDAMESVNLYLDGLLSKIESKDTYSLLSALFLGNTKSLTDNVKRDFTRLGLSHALALSGMHITIVVTILGFGVDRLKTRKFFKALILGAATLFFVGMTGFSDSAMRAGIMVCLSYLFSFFGLRINMTTSLFLSVTLICIFKPYSIFSVSLMLSFFAMLGCLSCSRIFKRVKLYRKIRNKLLRYIVIAFVTSMFAILFTLPITYVVFGCIPALAPVTNIALAPIFTFLIYLTPVYFVCFPIPYLSSFVEWFLTQISTFLLFAGEKCASLDGILVPIISVIQIIGVAVAIISVIALLIVNKNLCKYAIYGMICGVVIFTIGSVALYIDRSDDIYVGASAVSTGETLFIEENGQLSVFDVGSSSSLAYYTATHLGYYEVNRLVITEYNSRVCALAHIMCNSLIVKNLYLPHPKDEYESKILNQVYDITENSGTSLELFESTLETQNTTTLIYTHRIERSDKSIVAISVSVDDTTVTYLSGTTYEAPTYIINEMAYRSDVIIFGSQGPKIKASYEYEAPYLDYAMFLGKSGDYAKEEFYVSVRNKAVPYKKYPVRFKLTN